MWILQNGIGLLRSSFNPSYHLPRGRPRMLGHSVYIHNRNYDINKLKINIKMQLKYIVVDARSIIKKHDPILCKDFNLLNYKDSELNYKTSRLLLKEFYVTWRFNQFRVYKLCINQYKLLYDYNKLYMWKFTFRKSIHLRRKEKTVTSIYKIRL